MLPETKLFMYHKYIPYQLSFQKNKENKTKQEGWGFVTGRCAFPIYNMCFCLYVCHILITNMCSINLVIGAMLHISLFVYHYSIRKSFSINWKSKLIDSHSYSVLPWYTMFAIGQRTIQNSH